MLLLFVPFKDENDLLKPIETAEQSYIQNYTDGSCLDKHHQRCKYRIKSRRSIKTEHIDEPYVIEANATMNDVQETQANNAADDLALDRCIQMLNADQEHIFTQVLDYLQHQHRHGSELCNCTDFWPLYTFIRGVRGTGKSFLSQREGVCNMGNQ